MSTTNLPISGRSSFIVEADSAPLNSRQQYIPYNPFDPSFEAGQLGSNPQQGYLEGRSQLPIRSQGHNHNDNVHTLPMSPAETRSANHPVYPQASVDVFHRSELPDNSGGGNIYENGLVQDRSELPGRTSTATTRSQQNIRFSTVSSGGVSTMSRNINAERDLLNAVKRGKPGEARKAIDEGASVNIKDENGTPLIVIAARKFHEDVVTLLLDWGADPNLSSEKYETALICSASKGWKKIVPLLLDRGARIDLHTNGKYGTALRAALVECYIDIAEILMDHAKKTGQYKVGGCICAMHTPLKDIVQAVRGQKLRDKILSRLDDLSALDRSRMPELQ